MFLLVISAIFCDITQRRILLGFLDPWRCDLKFLPKRRWWITIARSVISQNSIYLIYFAAEAWNKEFLLVDLRNTEQKCTTDRHPYLQKNFSWGERFNLILLVREAVFRWLILPPSSETKNWSLKLDCLNLTMQELQSFETSVATSQLMQCAIPEDPSLQQHRCKNLKNHSAERYGVSDCWKIGRIDSASKLLLQVFRPRRYNDHSVGHPSTSQRQAHGETHSTRITFITPYLKWLPYKSALTAQQLNRRTHYGWSSVHSVLFMKDVKCSLLYDSRSEPERHCAGGRVISW